MGALGGSACWGMPPGAERTDPVRDGARGASGSSVLRRGEFAGAAGGAGGGLGTKLRAGSPRGDGGWPEDPGAAAGGVFTSPEVAGCEEPGWLPGARSWRLEVPEGCVGSISGRCRKASEVLMTW